MHSLSLIDPIWFVHEGRSGNIGLMSEFIRESHQIHEFTAISFLQNEGQLVRHQRRGRSVPEIVPTKISASPIKKVHWWCHQWLGDIVKYFYQYHLLPAIVRPFRRQHTTSENPHLDIEYSVPLQKSAQMLCRSEHWWGWWHQLVVSFFLDSRFWRVWMEIFCKTASKKTVLWQSGAVCCAWMDWSWNT